MKNRNLGKKSHNPTSQSTLSSFALFVWFICSLGIVAVKYKFLISFSNEEFGAGSSDSAIIAMKAIGQLLFAAQEVLILGLVAPICLDLICRALPGRFISNLAVVASIVVVFLAWSQIGQGITIENVLYSFVAWFGVDSGNLNGENASIFGCMFLGVGAILAGYFVGNIALISIPKHLSA